MSKVTVVCGSNQSIQQVLSDLINHIKEASVEESIEAIQSMGLDPIKESTLCELVYSFK